MPNRSLQTRIIALFLTLIVVVQLGGFVLVNSVGVSTARKSIGEDLCAGSRVFDRVRDQERVRLLQAARLLSADQAFRQAAVQRDGASLTPTLERYGKQIGAELLMLIRQDDVVAADTLGVGMGEPFFFPRLLAAGARRGRRRRDGRRARPALPARDRSRSPRRGLIAWVAVGYAVNDELAHEIEPAAASRRLVRQPSSEGRMEAAGEHAPRRTSGDALASDMAGERVCAQRARTATRFTATMR